MSKSKKVSTHLFAAGFMNRIATRLLHLIGSNGFLYVIIGLFALQAVWIALTMRYPGGFDENFHFGIIRIYAQQWGPFLVNQPPYAEVYGAVARDPSYLYHFLFSFPYRVIALFTDNMTMQIITLRLLNVLLATSGLFIFATAVQKLVVSHVGRNMIIAALAMIPIMPLMAGQISYDNLFLPLIALIMYLTFLFTEQLHAGTFNKRLLAEIILLGLVTSLVKYPFLPMFAGLMLYITFELFRDGRRLTMGLNTNLFTFWRGSHTLVGLKFIFLFLVVGLLFFERYGLNMLYYHTPVPDCAQVLTTDECQQYAPWGRDAWLSGLNDGVPRISIWAYARLWLPQLMQEFYFVVYGIFLPGGVVDYKVSPPVPLLLHTAWVVLSAGLIMSLLMLRRLLRHPGVIAVLFVSVTYVTVLFMQNYQMYRETGATVAIHGRYVLALVPFMLSVFYLASQLGLMTILKRLKASARLRVNAVICAVLLLLFTQGGGFVTYLVRSDDTYAWPQSQQARRANWLAKETLRPFVFTD